MADRYEVFCGVRDNRGFLWLGTRNGLNRYDGRRCLLFTRQRNQLQENKVVQLATDNGNHLFIEYGSSGFQLITNGKAAAELRWRTSSERNNAGFFVERSTDSIAWEDIAYIDGNATTTEIRNYSFRDEKPLPGVNYYRLRQKDFDGKTGHSNVQSVKFAGNVVKIGTDALRLVYIRTDETVEQVSITTLSGRLLLTSTATRLDLSRISDRIVIIRVQTATGITTKRVLLY